jgi:hypothetical protein
MRKSGAEFYRLSMSNSRELLDEFYLFIKNHFKDPDRLEMHLSGVYRLTCLYHGFASPLSPADAVSLLCGGASSYYMSFCAGVMKGSNALIKSGYKDRYILAPEYKKDFELFILKQERKYNTFLAEQRKKYPTK